MLRGMLACTLVVCAIAVASCSSESSRPASDTQPENAGTDLTEPDSPPVDSSDPGQDLMQQLPIEPSAGFLARQQEYLQACAEAHGPGIGGIHGQVCPVALADPVNQDALDQACEKLDTRVDCADFAAASLLRILYLDRETAALTEEQRAQIQGAVRGFKYWLDQPGSDKMCYWSENHQILFHSAELLAGQLFPDDAFDNSGWTGAEHRAHAEPLVLRWLDFRGRFGFSEWHSNVYFNEDIPALVNLADFAEDEVIRTKSAMVLDLLALDMLNNYYKGKFATVHGRTYPNKFLDGLKDSTSEAAWIVLNLGEYGSTGNFSGAFLATSASYLPPPLLEELAEEVRENHEHRQRDGVDVADGPAWEIGYTGLEDVIFWAGMAGLVAPDVIDGTVAMLDDYDLWDGFLFGDIPEEYKGLLEAIAGTPDLKKLAVGMEPVSRGIALESMCTYTYRTPHYQLSGAEGHKGGFWGSQTQAWQATLDEDAYAFTSFPANMGELGIDFEFGGEWIGGWLPRVTLHKNIAVIQYRKGELSMLEEFFSANHTHAFFPKAGFDEVVEAAGWVTGRKGDGYLALYSHQPAVWAEDNEYELLAEGAENVWLVEMGSAAENGTYEEFVNALAETQVTVGEKISYLSPSRGAVEVGWQGPMRVEGVEKSPVDCPRFDNEFVSQEFGSMIARITLGEYVLELDFAEGRRSLWTPTRID